MNKLNSNRHKLLWEKYLRRQKRIKFNRRKKNISNRASSETRGCMPLKYIEIPDNLSFGQNWERVVETLNDIKHTIKYRFMHNKANITIDHSMMSQATASGILVLASTIERSQKLARVKFKGIKEYLPKDEVVKYLLNEIDYWKYFDVPKLETNITQERFSFFKILDSHEVDNTKIGKMIEFFGKQVGFNGNTEELLFTALSEAAANTVEHGYISSTFNEQTDRWWLTASIDKREGSISFVFYDQGMGIFKSLKEHKDNKVKKLFNKVHNLIKDNPNAKILQHMVRQNLSKHKTRNRGYGIQTFKHFIDEANDGLLFIASENASYEYPANKLREYNNKLNGTMIVWKLNVSYDINSNIYLKKETVNDLL